MLQLTECGAQRDAGLAAVAEFLMFDAQVLEEAHCAAAFCGEKIHKCLTALCEAAANGKELFHHSVCSW